MKINIHLGVILSNTYTLTHSIQIPLCRVASIDSNNASKETLDYDKEKYKDMILDAAETVLGHFGFDRTLYGDKKNISKRKWQWFQEIRLERERDIEIEFSEKEQNY
jgi:hypothetical protein